jgi:hypothetical protein
VLKVKLQKLSENTIYDATLVYDVLFDAEESNPDSLQKKSRQLFLQAIDLYKNKKKPAEAVPLFKSSILVFPDAKSYYELGNALMETPSKKKLNEAISAYEVAERLGFQPASNVSYRLACANYMMYSKYADEKEKNLRFFSALGSLKDAFNSGFSDTIALKNDPRIGSIMGTPEYEKMIGEIRVERSRKGSNSFFASFTNSFPLNSGARFEISKEQVDMHDYGVSISYDFAPFIPEMQNTSFGREVSHDYFYVKRLAETPQYTAVVYSSVSFYGGNMQPVLTTLAIYDKEGKEKARKLISCQCSAEKIKTVVIEDNVIMVEDHRRIWDKPIDEVSFEDNTVKSYELLSKARYRIDETGEIVNEDVPKNYNDSTIVASK